eukprot:91101-Prymnesium_polylepis.2
MRASLSAIRDGRLFTGTQEASERVPAVSGPASPLHLPPDRGPRDRALGPGVGGLRMGKPHDRGLPSPSSPPRRRASK